MSSPFLIILWVVATAIVFYLIYRRLSEIRDELTRSPTAPLTAQSNTDASSIQPHRDTSYRESHSQVESHGPPIDPSMMVCRVCGALNEQEYWFCAHCVSPLHKW
jgi:hypothetical protein